MTKIEIIKKKIESLNKELEGTYLNKIISISKNDYIFSFSKNKNLFLSLNPQNPFFSLTIEKTSSNLNNQFLTKLKYKLNNSRFISINNINEDSIIDINLVNKEDDFSKSNYHLLFEVFKGNSNLILLKDNIIVLALKYHSLDSFHPIILGTNYTLPKKIEFNKDFIFEEEIKKEENYIENLDKIYLHEKYDYLLSKLKRKKKTLENKEKALLIDKNIALNNLNYKDYGDYFLTHLDEFKKGDNYFLYNGKKINIKENLDPSKNLNYLYKIYKKAKTTLSTIDSFLNEVKLEIDYINAILSIKDIFNEDDYINLIDDLKERKIINLKENNNNKKSKINKYYPYFIYLNNHKIGYGKMSYQNSYLTFNLAHKNDVYIHIKDFNGPHIIIFLNEKENYASLDSSFLNEVLEFALFLNKKKDATFLVSEVKNVKKGNSIGEANLLKYETYNIKSKKDDSYYINLVKKEERLIK